MTVKTSDHLNDFASYGKLIVIVAVMLLLSACGADDLWQGGEVKTKAATQLNAIHIDEAKDKQREMTDRLNALEGLYIDLMREVKTQNTKVAEMTSMMTQQKRQNLDASKLNGLANSVRLLESKMNQAISRISKTEMFLGKSSSQKQAPVEKGPENIGDGSQFAAQVGSFRTDEQVTSAWDKLKAKYSSEIRGLSAVKANVDIPNVGQYIRLLIGPFSSSSDAQSLCQALKAKGEPSCTVSPFKGKSL